MSIDLDEKAACERCKSEKSRIDSRTLGLSPTHPAATKYRDKNRWIMICPKCEQPHLIDRKGIALPFRDPNGVMRTALDLGTKDVLELAGFTFSRMALESGVKLANRESDGSNAPTSTSSVEQLARHYRQDPSHANAHNLCLAVCGWGGGGRVRGNLLKHHAHELGRTMDRWMQAALRAPTDEEAIAVTAPNRPWGMPKGLGVSFGSKHLRMLAPDRFAVLDAVISKGLGYALNPKGYALFMRNLRELHKQLVASDWPHSLARTEGGLFVLIRQNVRARAKQ